MGRRTILNQDIINRISEAIKKGHFIEDACILAGVSKQAYYTWLERATQTIELGQEIPEEDKVYVDFHYAVQKAEAELKDRIYVEIQDMVAKRNSWEGQFRFLESRFQSQWQRGVTIEHTYSEGTRLLKKLIAELKKPQVNTIDVQPLALAERVNSASSTVDDVALSNLT